jgi:ribosomal protein L12E/L44/L45/RPP1/RPP2
MADEKALTYTPKETALAKVVETASTALAAQAKATIEARYIMAERNPRDFDVVREKLLKDCNRPSFAAVAIYHKPIGNGIEGPSIRFAEAALRAMGNVDVSTQTVYDDDDRRIVRVSVTDLEANLPYSQDVTITKTVERRKLAKGDTPLRTRLNSYGDMLYILPGTDDDILNKQGALISKAVRTLGLRIVPGDLIDEAMAEVRNTQRRKDAEDPDAAKRNLFDSFADQGVTAEQLKEYLGHAGATLNPKEMKELRGLYAALRDGETSWREIMDARQPAPATDAPPPAASGKGGASRLKDAIKSAAPATPAAQPTTQAPTNAAKPNGHDDSDFFAN